MTIQDRLNQIPERLRLIKLALSLVWQAAGFWAVTWGVLLVIQGVLPAVNVYLTKLIVDGAAEVIGTGLGWEQVAPVVIPVSFMGAIIILQRLLSAVNEYVRTAQSEYVQDHIKELIHRQAASVDFAFYESAEYYDLLNRVNSQAAGRALAMLTNLGTLVQSIITFLSMAVLLLTYSIWIPLLLLISTIPAFLIILKYNRIHHEWWDRTTSDRRWAQYYDTMLTLQAAAAEVRLNKLGSLFTGNYQELRERLRSERLTLVKRQAIAKLGASAVAILVTAGTMAWIFMRAMRGDAKLGDLALFYQAFSQGQSLMGGILRNLGQIYDNTLYLEHLQEFMGQPRTVKDPDDAIPFPDRIEEGVAFENITFTYPETSAVVLDRFSLFLPAGKLVAIVGDNGAGKSTLIKLLCRFYDPDAGRITVDGQDIRSFTQDDLRRHISVMFQFPMKYQLTARQNIELGDPEAAGDSRKVQEAAESGGANEIIEGLPKGYDSLLGRWFKDGNELSGGEWQRMALARAFFREAPIIVLDEPTSFMDTWAENEWLRDFNRLVKNKSVLVVTHRLAMARQADLIYVMADGELVESGTHDELLRKNGRYAESWTSQVGSTKIKDLTD